jgi:hypothetical protein
VVAEVITWLMRTTLEPTQLGLAGQLAAVAGKPSKLTVRLLDDAGFATSASSAVTVNLSSSAASGRFDTAWNGSFSGAITSVTVPAGATSASLYYKDSSTGAVTISASAAGLTGAQWALQVFQDVPGEMGEVLIFTGPWWLARRGRRPGPDHVDTLTAGDTHCRPRPKATQSRWWTRHEAARWICSSSWLLSRPYLNPNRSWMTWRRLHQSTDGDVIMNHGTDVLWPGP